MQIGTRTTGPPAGGVPGEVELPALLWLEVLLHWTTEFQHRAETHGALARTRSGDYALQADDLFGIDIAQMVLARTVLQQWLRESIDSQVHAAAGSPPKVVARRSPRGPALPQETTDL